MSRPLRVMWLINHTTLRKFEIPQMESLGVSEIFLPKSFPYDEGNLSANIDWSRDSALNIPEDKLSILNEQDWYKSPSEEAWEIANQYFDVIFHGFFPDQIRSIVNNFNGVVVLHGFGLAGNETYSALLRRFLSIGEFQKFQNMSDRFFFGAGYEHLAEIEETFIRSRECFLPVGLTINDKRTEWTGTDKRIFFVCPRINTSGYFHNIYEDFAKHFSEFGYVIGGAQPVPHSDKRVLGFVDRETHDRNMRELAVMFYHSQEPNHIHYHPFEAIQAGMPLIFMSGGVLDQFGGIGLPGRCTTIDEAKRKIRKVLNGDKAFIASVRRTQVTMLDPMRPENCAPHWRLGFSKITQAVAAHQSKEPAQPKKKKIAILLPIEYRGGTLRAAKLIAQAIVEGSRQAGDSIEVIFGHIDDPNVYSEDDFSDLPDSIKRRAFRWKVLSADQARNTAEYANIGLPAQHAQYQVPDDGVHQFLDCDFWLFVSDRIMRPLLMLRPFGMFVFDYLQRYQEFLPKHLNDVFLETARNSECVFVTTEFTRGDALVYAGIRSDRVVKLPILSPDFSRGLRPDLNESSFFIWTTNGSRHKNHENAIRALAHYYDELDGGLKCKITGVDSDKLMSGDIPQLKNISKLYKQSTSLRNNLEFVGELPDPIYRSTLSQAAFLWHAASVDNGTFSVVEAAHVGVPSLSSDYPAMREFNDMYELNLQWMNPRDSRDMAKQLKRMESAATDLRKTLPSSEKLNQHSVDNYARAYWDALKQWL